jgi:polyferredoxin
VATRFGRTWCNTIWPLGTVISSLSFIDLVQPKVDQQSCIDFDFNCLHCELICPMQIPLTCGQRWQMKACTKCLKCWTQCPANAVKLTFVT